MRLTDRWPLGLRSAVAATVALGIALTVATFALEDRSARARLDRMADLVASAMQERMAQYVAILRSTRSYLEAEEGQIDPAKFGVYLGRLELDAIASGIQGIGIAPLIPTDQTAAAARILSQQHHAAITIHPETGQPIRAPIALLEPMDSRNRAALGFDMFAEPVRRAAIVAARESFEPRASAPVELVQEITAVKQTGFLIYLRSRNGLADLPAEGALVYAPFRAGDLHRAVLADLPDMPLTVRSVDLGDPSAPLFDNMPETLPARLARLTVTRDIDVAGRQWRLTIAPSAVFGGLRDRSATVTVAVLSLLLTTAVWAAMASQARSLDSARRTAALAEQQAADRALLLREMQHRIKNHIARIQAISRHSIRGARDLQHFQTLFHGRLGAMAKAQDALGRDATQRADLRSVLESELTQVLRAERVEAALEGPKVTLDARETQAVGLVAHELLTNAMKYSGSDAEGEDTAMGGLRASWRVEPRGDQRWLHIDWFEPAARQAADTAPGWSGGFGTQLIEALVEGDLGGSFARKFGPDGMRVTLGFPLSSG